MAPTRPSIHCLFKTTPKLAMDLFYQGEEGSACKHQSLGKFFLFFFLFCFSFVILTFFPSCNSLFLGVPRLTLACNSCFKLSSILPTGDRGELATQGTCQGKMLGSITTASQHKDTRFPWSKAVIIPGYFDLLTCPIMPLQTPCHSDNLWELSQVHSLLGMVFIALTFRI